MSRAKSEWLKTITLILLAVLLVYLLWPILRAAGYARPVNDDFSFSYLVHRAASDHSSVIIAAFQEVKNIYFSWQGTFSAIFLFSVQPGVFSKYWLTTWVLVGSLLLGTILFFLYQQRCMSCDAEKARHSRNEEAGIMAIITVIVMVECMPSISEGLFWYNGAIYYTFFFSLQLIVTALAIGIYLEQTGRLGKIIAVILTAIIGGGNYTTALVTSETIFLATLISGFQAWKGRKNSKTAVKKKTVFLLCLFLVSILSLGISMLAPGNQIRSSIMGDISAIWAISEAFVQSVQLIREYSGFPQLIYALLLFLLSLAEYRNRPERKHPLMRLLVISALLYLLFVSGLVPPLYGVGNIGAGRQQNIYYYSYIIILALESRLLAGCLQGVLRNNKRAERNSKYVGGIFLAAAIVLCIWHYDVNLTTSAQVHAALKNGSLERYNLAYDTMLERLKQAQGSGADVVVNRISSTPLIFEGLQLEDDTDGWVNIAMARYYGLGSIRTGELAK